MATIGSELLWTKDSAGTAAGGAEVSAYDAARGLVLILGPDGVEALDVRDGATRFSLPSGDLGPLGNGNSVAVSGDVMAVAYDSATPGGNGSIAFYRIAADGSGAALIRQVEVGAVPDMVTFTPDGSRLLVAIEGEPNANYGKDASGDPAGGVAVIDVATGASRFLGFEGFDTEALRAAGVRIEGVPGVTAATDLEPEYIAVSADGTKAYVTLQENNAIAVLDLETLGYTGVYGLGTKDHSVPGNGLDTSDRDGGTDIATAPIRGLYMPDGIATFERDGKTYLVTANEGDASEWGSYSDVVRLKNAKLDEASFGGAAAVAALKNDAELGRLNISAVDGDTDGDGDIDVIHAFGGRSFSIWEVTPTGLVQTFDSGDMMERMLLANAPSLLDDGRSDDKGPEPESVTLGVVDGQLYAFLALERSDAVMAFAIESPTSATYAGVVPTADAPEVIHFIPAADAPDGVGSPILISPAEGTGITTAHKLEIVPARVDGTAGTDRLLGSEGRDALYGLGGDDTLIGNGGNDLLYGGAGNDRLLGKAGDDTMAGGAGDDSYYVDDAGDVVIELADEGTDRVVASVNFTLSDAVENLLLTGTATSGTGNALANRMQGNELANTLDGRGGNDKLYGFDGDDLLIGGAGRNTLVGGEGADRFRFDGPVGGGNLNTLGDFTAGTDRIELDRSVYTALSATGPIAAEEFGFGRGATTAQQHILYDAASGKIFYDADGAGGGAAVLVGLTAQPNAGLTAADIWVV